MDQDRTPHYCSFCGKEEEYGKWTQVRCHDFAHLAIACRACMGELERTHRVDEATVVMDGLILVVKIVQLPPIS